MSAPLLPITAIIPTYNEEQNLEPCLQSLDGWIGEVFVVDSGSTDATVDIAKRYGARVVTHPFETHARQWQWALQNLPCTHEWILGLDADQRVTPELRDELGMLFTREEARLEGVHGFYAKRRQVFRGRWIRHGGYYPKYLLKLARRSEVEIDVGDLVDHHFVVRGPVARLRHDVVEENRKEDDIGFWIEKHNRYASLLAREELNAERNSPPVAVPWSTMGDPDGRVRWRKRLWRRLPLYARPFLYFGYRYVLRLGFLDGKEGLIFHFLHACWFRLLVDVKREDLQRSRGR